MKLTTIQLHEETRKKLERKKTSLRESYDSVVNRILEDEGIPSMEEMFRQADKMKCQKTTIKLRRLLLIISYLFHLYFF